MRIEKRILQNSKLSCHVSLSFSNLSDLSWNKEEQTLTVIVIYHMHDNIKIGQFPCLLAVSFYLLSRYSIILYHDISLYHREKKTFVF